MLLIGGSFFPRIACPFLFELRPIHAIKGCGLGWLIPAGPGACVGTVYFYMKGAAASCTMAACDYGYFVRILHEKHARDGKSRKARCPKTAVMVKALQTLVRIAVFPGVLEWW